jgi:hypothetical protein
MDRFTFYIYTRILSHVLLTVDGVWIGEHSQVVSTSNYNSVTGLHTLKITATTSHKVKFSISALTSRCWVTGPTMAIPLQSFTRRFLVTNLSWLTLNY